MQLVKELKGHSGAGVSLYDNNTVVKSGYLKARQSADILESLPFKTPHVHSVTDDTIVMDYVAGEDIHSYFEHGDNESVDNMIKFIDQYFDWCLGSSHSYNFHDELETKVLELGPYINMGPVAADLKYDMPKSIIHGDFTFDNILHKDGEFYLIDANPTPLSSIHFDGAKLRQDIDGYWFLRSKKSKGNSKICCLKIKEHLKAKYEFMNNNALYYFMLSRILPYSKDKNTTKFLTEEMDKIWPL